MDTKIKLLVDTFGKDKFKLKEPLVDYTELKVGGPAEAFFVAVTQQELIRLVGMCQQLKLPCLVFGSGSKMMISDHGFSGLVIKNRTRNIKIISIKGKVSKGGIGVDEALVEVESGVSMNSLVEFLDSQGLRSGEFVSLPGTVGGNLFINKSLQDKTEKVVVLNKNLRVEQILVGTLNLNKQIILSVILKIKAK